MSSSQYTGSHRGRLKKGPPYKNPSRPENIPGDKLLFRLLYNITLLFLIWFVSISALQFWMCLHSALLLRMFLFYGSVKHVISCFAAVPYLYRESYVFHADAVSPHFLSLLQFIWALGKVQTHRETHWVQHLVFLVSMPRYTSEVILKPRSVNRRSLIEQNIVTKV